MADSARHALASQLAVLRNCLAVISRLLKGSGSTLPAAQVLVIARLLHTKLLQRPKPPPYLETLKTKLGTLRRRLLNRIDQRFRFMQIGRDALVDTMYAFSLATSSSSNDMLSHFLHIRKEAISEKMDEKSPTYENLLVALRLYLKTLGDMQAIIPSQLANSLENLVSTPLLKSPDVRSLTQLNLDIHERWIDDDILTFTPYIRQDDPPPQSIFGPNTRHDDPPRPIFVGPYARNDDPLQMRRRGLLRVWARETFIMFLMRLRLKIQAIVDPLAVVQLRRQIFEFWLSSHELSLSINTAEAVDKLRKDFNDHLAHIARSRASQLARVGTVVKNSIQEWQPGISDFLPSLWDSTMTSVETSKGGEAFRGGLADRVLGKNGLMSNVSRELISFLENINAVEEVIKDLRETTWADIIDDVDNEDDLLDNTQVFLSQDDPNLLQDKLNAALSEAYTDLATALDSLRPYMDDENCSQKICFLLRTWREIRQHLPRSYQNLEIGLKSIDALQKSNAKQVLLSPIADYRNRVQKALRAATLSVRPLWEGDPSLPILPSTWTYRLLLDLTASMTACGSDTWSPQVTETLKRTFIEKVVPVIERVSRDKPTKANGHTNGEIDGETKLKNIEEATKEESTGEEPADTLKEAQIEGTPLNGVSDHSDPANKSRDLTIQTLFDVHYLINATHIKNISLEDNELISLQKKLLDDLTLEKNSAERIKKDAGDYWKRTSLLFGLLG